MSTEVNTFSAAVDDVIRRSGRPDRRADVISYVRQTLRECQALATFMRDMTEDTITATASPHIWDRPQEFRIMRTVRYNIFNARGEAIYPEHIRPSKRQRDLTYFYYAGIDYWVFAGVSSGVEIDVAYHSYFKKLPYYLIDARPATFDLETDTWSYDTASTDAEKEAARLLVTNWLLFDWYDLMVEGGMAKIFKTVGDQRAGSSFALYKSLQKTLLSGEDVDSLEN